MKIKRLIKLNLMRAAMTLALILASATAWASTVLLSADNAPTTWTDGNTYVSNGVYMYGRIHVQGHVTLELNSATLWAYQGIVLDWTEEYGIAVLTIKGNGTLQIPQGSLDNHVPGIAVDNARLYVEGGHIVVYAGAAAAGIELGNGKLFVSGGTIEAYPGPPLEEASPTGIHYHYSGGSAIGQAGSLSETGGHYDSWNTLGGEITISGGTLYLHGDFGEQYDNPTQPANVSIAQCIITITGGTVYQDVYFKFFCKQLFLDYDATKNLSVQFGDDPDPRFIHIGHVTLVKPFVDNNGTRYDATTSINMDTFRGKTLTPALDAVLYNINRNNPEHGTVQTSVNGFATTTALESQVVTVETEPEPGYQANISVTGATLSANTFIMHAEDVTVTVNFTPEPQYAIHYELNGGTQNNNNPSTFYPSIGVPSFAAPWRTGYQFNNWYGNNNFTGDPITSIAPGTTGEQWLYARWTANTYNVAFNANGGTGTMEPQTHIYDASQALTSNAFTRTGYAFSHWATNPDGTGTTYTNGQTVQNLTTSNGATIPLYAQWNPITYTVSFNANGGTGTMAAQTHTYDASQALTSNTFTRTGYTFAGWATTATGNVAYTNGQTVSNLASTQGANVELFAKWTPITYTVSFNANGGEGTMAAQTHTYDASQALTSNAFTNAGYSFTGWATDADDDVVYTNGQSVSNLASTQDANVELFAKWTVNPAHFSGTGTEADPYLIKSAEGWNVFCNVLLDGANYNHFIGKTVKLDADITVSRMAGSTGFQNYHPFCGTFDGNHKTITFNKGTANSPESDHSALFAATEASDQFTGSNETVVVIKDLTVDGTIYTSSDCAAGLVGSASARLTITGCQSNITIHTSSQYAAGFVSSSSGILNITDCVSSATIISSYNGNGYHGGFIGKSSLSTNTITGCLFTGKLLTTNNTQNCGGFIGWYSPNQSSSNWSNDIIVNSICKPAPLESGETAITSGSPFVCWNPEDTTNEPKITNSYYFEASVPNTQLLGKAAHSIAAGHDVTMSIVGTPNQYNLSGITYFDTSTQYFTLQNECLQFANELYAGLGDEVSITLEHPETPEGYLFDGYSPAGNLGGSGNDYTLTMPDADVVITAPQSIIHYTITYHLNDGAMPTGVSNPSTYTIEDDDITLNNPEKEGYIFGGWYGNESFLYGVVTTIAHGSTGNKELYARWGSGVPYIDADGSLQHHECVELTGNETDNLAEGWYVVRNTNPNGVDLTYTNWPICQGDLNLILCDGAEVHFNDGLLANGTFTIYGQSEGTGTLIASSSSSALSASSYNKIIINGGTINATCTAEDYNGDDIAAIKAGENITINRGIVNANGGQAPAVSTLDLHFNGGNFSATSSSSCMGGWPSVTLSWTNPTDSFFASNFGYANVTIAEDKIFVDAYDNLYFGDVDVYESGIEGKTLRPYDAPTHLTVSGITMTSATLTWEAFFKETQWQVSWSEDDGSTWSTPVAVNEPQYEVTGLTPGATVQVKVKGVFGENLYGHAATRSFNTHTACDAPEALISDALSYTATLNWTGFQDNYNVRYATVTTTTILNEGFEDGLPTDWMTTEEEWQVTTGTGFDDDEYGAATGDYNAGCYIYGLDNTDILVTPAMDLSSGTSATLSFNFLNPGWQGRISTLNVYYRVNEGDWHLLYTNDQYTEGWIPVTVSLKGLAPNYQIGFEYVSEFSGMGIDDVKVTTNTIGDWIINSHVTSPYTINNLVEETQYVWQVQGNTTSTCGGSATEWVESFFTTEPSNAIRYIDENGDTKSKLPDECTVLDETLIGTTLEPGWYVVNHDVTINTDKRLQCNGELNIILLDGCTFTITSSSRNGIFGIYGDNSTLNIYGQTAGTGTLNISATNTTGSGIYCEGGVNIAGGIINVSSRGSDGILSKGTGFSFSGGQVYATASSNYHGIRSWNDMHFSWRNPTDRIYASKYEAWNYIIIAPGKSFIDEEAHTYSGSYEYDWIDGFPNLDGKTLYPHLDGTVSRTITGYGESDTEGWVFISSPVSGSIEPVDVINLLGEQIQDDPVLYDYDLYRFNQDAEKEWQNWKQDEGNNNVASGFSLVNGQGYLYATKQTKTLIFTSDSFNTNDTMTVNLDYTEGKRLAGWNLVGNPFTVSAYIDRPYYELVTIDGQMVVDPNTETGNSRAIAPVTGVMVKANGTGEKVFFSKTPLQQSAINNGHLHITLAEQQVTTRGEVSSRRIDKAIVSFNEGEELGKFYFGTQNANIYIPQGQEEYAIASSNGQGEMPLNFKANADGQYTLTVSATANSQLPTVNYLHLIDNMTGADVDLLAANGGDARHGDAINRVSTYTFTAKTTDYESRFKLVFAVGSSTGSDTFAFISNGNIIVNGTGTLQVIDMTGRFIVQGDAINRVSTDGMTAGVYVLRLINGENVKTQKIVVE